MPIHVVPISDDQVAVKSGVREVLIKGPGIRRVAESVVPLLDGECTRAEILDGLDEPSREQADKLIESLTARGFVGDAGRDDTQQDFYANFPATADAPACLAAASVAVFGHTYAARSLVRGLLEVGVGDVLVVATGPVGPVDAWPSDDDRLRVTADHPSDDEVGRLSVLCATHDFGPPDVLLDTARLALRSRVPFLPVWLSDMVGHVGPLTHPFDTACLRCYLLRTDSNNPRYPVSTAIRERLAELPDAARSTGMLPPMAGVLGEIAAVEVVKLLTGFAPNDTVAHAVEINLVSFQTAVRRVLKVPRCPDCGEVSVRGPRVLTVGPQIPQG